MARLVSRVVLGLLALVLLLAFCAAQRPELALARDCTVEPASQWAPQGFICPPVYGVGTASRWQGPGAARNDCVYPWTHCVPITVTSLQTGLTITVTPVTWCHCWVGVRGPHGERERIVDLGPELVAALGLDPAAGLWPVKVQPASSLPDTAMER